MDMDTSSYEPLKFQVTDISPVVPEGTVRDVLNRLLTVMLLLSTDMLLVEQEVEYPAKLTVAVLPMMDRL